MIAVALGLYGFCSLCLGGGLLALFMWLGATKACAVIILGAVIVLLLAIFRP